MPATPNAAQISVSTMLKALQTRAKKLGFGEMAVLNLDEFDQQAGVYLSEFIAQNHHGTMGWMKETLERRQHPRAMWPQANTAFVLGYNYGPDCDPLTTLDQGDKATISVYARGRDYHSILKGKLKELAQIIAKHNQKEVKVFVDTAPLMEKPLAHMAGLGWQGKHTNLVNRTYGSWLFLGVILSEQTFSSEPIGRDHCGSCTACLDICPTQAFPAPYKLDARRCISYLTIEHAGPIEVELREKMGNRIYGCDDCLAVCPWNKYAQVTHDIKLSARADLNAPELSQLCALDEAAFRSHFSGSPIKRIGHKRFIRNVLYAIGNGLKDPKLSAQTRADLHQSAKAHIHSEDEVVRDAAHWAIAQIEPP